MPPRPPRHARATAAVTGVVLLSAIVRFEASRGVAVPWIAPDEPIYMLLGRSLYEHGTLSILGGSTPYYSLLYPVLVGPAMALDDLALGITVLQAVQAVLMSSTAALVYVWARRSAGDGWALAAAVLAVAIPGLAYSGLVMTEAAYYPFVTLALVATARMLARPSVTGQLAVLAACALACSIRLQAVVLLPTAVVAVLLAAFFARERALLRSFRPLLGTIGATVAVGGLVTAAGLSPVGAYTVAVHQRYHLGAVLRDVAWHAGDVAVLVAAVPLVALVALAVPAVRGRERDPDVRATLAVTLAYVPLLVLEVGMFASRYVDHLAERDLLTAVPPLFVVFATWLRRGLPRPQPWTSAAALAIAAAALLLPISKITAPSAFLDSFNAIPIRRLAERTSEDSMRLLFAAATAGLVALAVLVPRRLAMLLPALVGALLVASSAVSSAEIRHLSRADQRWWFANADPGWVDAVADGPVVYLQAGTRFWGGVWKHAARNHRIAQVARLPDSPVPGPIATTVVGVRFDGLITVASGRPLRAERMVVPFGLRPAGTRLAAIRRSADLPGLELWRVDRPARVASWTRGVASNGDIHNRASVTAYDCHGGRLALTLIGKSGAPVDILEGGRPVRRIALPPESAWSGTVQISPPPGSRVCTMAVVTAGLLGSTRIRFVDDGG